MYGGRFAVIPAYLAGIFETKNGGVLHECLLTAWSLAGVIAIESYYKVIQYF